MLLLEQGSAALHPVGTAAGSQSCASLFPHEALHAEVVRVLFWVTQHTVPAPQFAAPRHLSAVVFPPVATGHVPPAKQA